MMPHPDPEELAAFGLGRLDPERQAEIERHVAVCETCCDALRVVSDDTLVAQLKSAPVTVAATPLPGGQPPEESIPPELLDHPRYRVLRRLGAGGMGEVYEAEHRMMGRRVALKVINRRLLRHAEALSRFQQEVKAAARLHHPNIVTAFDADQAGDLNFLVMELVDGVSVARQVERGGPLSVRHACQFARQAASGLQHAHELGMVHRDIKPQNLMLTRQGRLKILDFGLARFARDRQEQDQPDVSLTGEGMTLGTPDYMAPEQIRSARYADIRADIYALGGTLYFMLAGHSPFPVGSVAERLAAQLEREPEPLDRVRDDLPPGLDDVFRHMMAKDPARRYQTPAQVAEALAPFCRSDTTVVDDQAATLAPRPAAPIVAAAAAASPPQSSLPAVPESPTAAGTLGTVRGNSRRRSPRNATGVSRLLRLSLAAVVLLLIAALCTVAWNVTGRMFGGGQGSVIAARRVLIVVPQRDLWYPDYVSVREPLERQGVQIEVAAAATSPAVPSTENTNAAPVPVDLPVSAADPARYDAVVFTGAYPWESFDHLQDDSYRQSVQRLIDGMLADGKPVTALCLGSMVLADLGVLKDRDAARCPYQPDTPEYEAKANWDDAPVRSSPPILTGRDADAAAPFCAELLRELARNVE